MPATPLRRLTIDLPEELYRRLKDASAQTNMREFCVSAINTKLREGPGPLNCHFAAPNDPSFVNFDREVKQAGELWMAGLTLRSLTRQFGEMLEARVREGLRMRLLIMHPDLGPDSNVLRATQAWIRSGEPEPVSRLVADIEESTRAFAKLKATAPDPRQIEVRGHKRIMSFGLSIADPTSGFGQARINLYLFGGASSPDPSWLGQRHPALFVKQDTGSAGAPYDLLVNHFNRMWMAAEGDNLA